MLAVYKLEYNKIEKLIKMGGNYYMSNIHKISNTKASVPTKGLAFFIAVLLFLSAIPLLVTANEPNTIKEITKSFEFSAPTLVPDGDYVQLQIEGADQYTAQAGTPLLATHNGVIKLPLGATNIEVDFTITSDIKELEFEGLIAPSPTPQLTSIEEYPLVSRVADKLGKLFDRQDNPYGKPESTVAALDDDAYGPGAFGEYFRSNIYVGIDPTNDNNLVTYVTYTMHPFTFTSVAESQGEYFTDAVVTVTYEEGEAPIQTLDSDEGPYDLVIISANDYIADLLPLVAHKEDMGFDTKLVSIDDITSELYF